ncbi:GIY-YIG nuclease family protein [Gordonia sinesedis]
MAGYMYILECADGSYYVGSTADLELRIEQHNSGRGCAYTSGRLPVELVYAVECETVAAAYEFERRVHGWSRAKRRALIDGDLEALPGLARRHRKRPA